MLVAVSEERLAHIEDAVPDTQGCVSLFNAETGVLNLFFVEVDKLSSY